MGRIAPGDAPHRDPVRHRRGARCMDANRGRRSDNVPSYRSAARRHGRGPRDRTGHRRRRVGRQLVLPGRRSRPGARRSTAWNALTDYAWRIRQALERAGITGDDGGEIDHIELFGPPTAPAPTARTSCSAPARPTTARRAAPAPAPSSPACTPTASCAGEVWRQESIVGSVFEGDGLAGRGRPGHPEITGSAYVNAEADLILDERDPFCYGIRGACAQAST